MEGIRTVKIRLVFFFLFDNIQTHDQSKFTSPIFWGNEKRKKKKKIMCGLINLTLHDSNG